MFSKTAVASEPNTFQHATGSQAGQSSAHPGFWRATNTLTLWRFNKEKKSFERVQEKLKPGVVFTVGKSQRGPIEDNTLHNFFHIFTKGGHQSWLREREFNSSVVNASKDQKRNKRPANGATAKHGNLQHKDTGMYNDAAGDAEEKPAMAGADKTQKAAISIKIPFWGYGLTAVGLAAGCFAAYKYGKKYHGHATAGHYILAGTAGALILSLPGLYVGLEAGKKKA
jgi:hypothetical protein